jgi:hypothetical protein
MKTSLARVMLIVAAALLLWAGCGKDKGNGPEKPKPYSEAVITVYVTSPLPAGYAFELWAKPADTALYAQTSVWQRVTRFNLDASGGLLDSNGALVAGNRVKNLPVDLDDYDSLQITIERTDDDHTTPSQTVYLHGRIPPNLDSAHVPRLEFPSPIGQSSNYFMMLTPTDSDTSDELSGVWFIFRDQPGPSDSGLFIPPAPAGWLYEGWVHHSDAWLSTGKFRRAAGSDMENPYCGAGTRPQFPGEDFLQNAPAGLGFTFPFELTAGDVVQVTLEPDPDPSADPFRVTLLSDTLSGQIAPATLTGMTMAPREADPAATLDIRQAGN